MEVHWKKVENFLKNVRVEFFWFMCKSDWLSRCFESNLGERFVLLVLRVNSYLSWHHFKIFIVMKLQISRNKESFGVHSFLMTPTKEPRRAQHKNTRTNPLIVQSNWPSSKNFFQINLSTKKYCMLHVKKNWHVILKLARSLSADLFKFNFFVKRDDCSINRRFLVEFSLVRQRDCVGEKEL